MISKDTHKDIGDFIEMAVQKELITREKATELQNLKSIARIMPISMTQFLTDTEKAGKQKE